MNMICLMHRSRKYGYLLVSGRAPTLAKLAKLCNSTPKRMKKYLKELEEAQVVRKEDKVYFSQRMTKDKAYREDMRSKKSEAGKRGAEARWGKDKSDKRVPMADAIPDDDGAPDSRKEGSVGSKEEDAKRRQRRTASRSQTSNDNGKLPTTFLGRVSHALEEHEGFIHKDTHIVVDQMLACFPNMERNTVWAAAIASRKKPNPAGYFASLLANGEWSPPDGAQEQAKKEIDRYYRKCREGGGA